MDLTDNVILSNFAQSLPSDVKERYIQRLSSVKLSVDPYMIEKVALKVKVQWITFQLQEDNNVPFPKINEIDIYKYFVERQSFYSTQEVKAYKSLEAYNFFISGHVRNVRWTRGHSNKNMFLILAEVLHSQRISEKGVELWLIVDESGDTTTANCKCVAGNAESCSHIAAVCYYFLFYHKKKDNTSVTDVKAYWVQPSASTATVSPKKIRDICYENVKKKAKRMIEGKVNNVRPIIVRKLPQKVDFDLKNDSFLHRIAEASPKSAMLRVVPPFCTQMAKENEDVFPKSFGSLFKDEHTSKSLDELIDIGLHLNITLNKTEIKAIENATVDQSSNRLWFTYRTGRITASNAYAVSNTRSLTSNLSLIKKICYPVKSAFSSAATEWGCRHEKKAVEVYLQRATNHRNLLFRKCGLFIHHQFPFIGASPDGLLTCDCCGVGGLEIKCPFCLKEKDLSDMQYLNEDSGDLRLSKNHPYYYQVITQIFCVGMRYCDFVVWSPKEMFIERIYPDENTWKVIVAKSEYYFHHAIIPELLARFFSDGKHKNTNIPISGESIFCICKKNVPGKTIICGQEGCSNVKYHMKCVNLKRRLKNWICSDCSNTKVA